MKVAGMSRNTPPRFFVDPSSIFGNIVILTGDVLKHAMSQRLKRGEIFHALPEMVYDKNIVTETIELLGVRVESVNKTQLIGQVIETRQVTIPPYELHLYPAVLKGDKLDLVVEKATELGCASITPMVAARCIPRLDEGKKESRIQRWMKVAKSAAEQSGRMYIPRINEIVTFREVIQNRVLGKAVLALERREMCVSISEAVGCALEVSVLIGPEGGFELYEIEEAVEAGLCPVTLGPYILRAETASIAACAIIMEHMSKGHMAKEYIS